LIKTKILLICCVNREIGIGHLSRLLALADKLKFYYGLSLEFLIFGDYCVTRELSTYKINNYILDSNILDITRKHLESEKRTILVFDLHKSCFFLDKNFKRLLLLAKKDDIPVVSIGNFIEHCELLDLIWIPSFHFDISPYRNCPSIIRSGWDTLLIQKRNQLVKWRPGKKVLILTGGSDVANLGKSLPKEIDNLSETNIELNWVKGPFSEEPSLPKNPKLKWITHDSPENLDDLIVSCNYAITVFGVSFFEIIQYGIPCVVFSPYGTRDLDEFKVLEKENIASIAKDYQEITNELSILMKSETLAKKYSKNSLKKMSKNGATLLAQEISKLEKKEE